jgi:hypothetical protein
MDDTKANDEEKKVRGDLLKSAQLRYYIIVKSTNY